MTLGYGFRLPGPRRGGGVALAAPPPGGFAGNGAGNARFKAMLSRVRAGTGRGRLVFKGDSTTAGASETNLRTGRVSAYLAAQLAGAGIAALDNSFVGHGQFASLPTHDPRVGYAGNPWLQDGGQAFAGGGFLNWQSNSGALTFTPTTPVDTFEIVVFNVGGAVTIAIDGASPAALAASGGSVAGATVSVPSTGSGFTRITATAASAGTRTVSVTGSNPTLLRSITGYESAVRAIDILNHAAGGAKSLDQAASGNNWQNNDALGFDAPDLTIINCELNTGNNYAITQQKAYLQAMIDKARLSGDVLLVSSYEASEAFFSRTTQAAIRQASSEVAAANGIAYIDLASHFGPWEAIQARLADSVHGKTELYAEIAQVYRRCLEAMAA